MKIRFFISIVLSGIVGCTSSIQDITEQVKADLMSRQEAESKPSPPIVTNSASKPIKLTEENQNPSPSTLYTEKPSSNTSSNFSKADLWEKCYQDLIRLPARVDPKSNKYLSVTDIVIVDGTKSPIKESESIVKEELKAKHYEMDAEVRWTYSGAKSSKYHYQQFGCRYSEWFNPYKFYGGVSSLPVIHKTEDAPLYLPPEIPEPTLDDSFKQTLYEVCLNAHVSKYKKLYPEQSTTKAVRWFTPLARQVHGSNGGYYYKVRVNFDGTKFVGDSRSCHIINTPDKGLVLRNEY